MKTFVLCGGEGTRLRPHTYTTPKPMLLLGGKPILQYVIENLKRNGLTDLVLTTGYLHKQIVEYFGDGGKFGMRIEYLVEKEAQNTAGSILPYKGRVKEPFMVVMGDHYTDVDVKSMAEFHQKNKAIATLGLLPHETKVEFGVVEMDGDTVKRFVEKPVLTHTINIGMYVFEPEIFRFIKEKEDFAKDVFPRLLANGKRINGFTVQGEWDDVGRVADYERLKEQVEGK